MIRSVWIGAARFKWTPDLGIVSEGARVLSHGGGEGIRVPLAQRSSVCVSLAFTACSSGSGVAPGSAASQDAAGVDAPVDALAVSGDAAVRPEKTACVGDVAWCLFGTASVTGFGVGARGLTVALYRVFPSGSQVPLASQLVANDGTWAFSGLDTIGVGGAGTPGDAGAAWSHYYVALGVGFGHAADGQAPPQGSVIAGPLTVPSSGDGAAGADGSIDLTVKPVSVQLAESVVGGSAKLDWASARVLDPATGTEITGADSGVSVAIAIGDASVPLLWTASAPRPSFYAPFGGSTPAQSDYTVTTTWAASLDAAPMTSLLSAAPPDFVGMVTFPLADASVAAHGPLDVAWTAEPQADYEIVEVFKNFNTDGGPASWGLTYASPKPQSPSSMGVRIGGDGDAGSDDAGTPLPGAGLYLINVFYTKANCPASKDGCVYATTAAATVFSAH